MNALQSMMQGAEFGNGIYQRKQQNQMGALAAMGNLGGAYKMAQQTGNTGAAKDYQSIMNGYDEQQRKMAAEQMAKATNAAIGILQASGGDEAKMFEMMVDVGPQFGISQDMLMQAQRSPKAALLSLVAQNEEFQKAYAENAKDYTLSVDQVRGNGGNTINSNVQYKDSDMGGSRSAFNPETGQYGAAVDKTQSFSDINTEYANQTGRMNAQTDRMKANQAQDEYENPTTDDMTEYLFAQRDGFKGSFVDWKNQGGAKNVDPIKQGLQREEVFEKIDSARTGESAANQTLNDIRELLPPSPDENGNMVGGKYSDGFDKAFGVTWTWKPDVFKSGARKNSEAVLRKIVNDLTLDKAQNFKGAMSDKDLEIAMNAATILKDPKVSDEAAKKALKTLQTVFMANRDKFASKANRLTALVQPSEPKSDLYNKYGLE